MFVDFQKTSICFHLSESQQTGIYKYANRHVFISFRNSSKPFNSSSVSTGQFKRVCRSLFRLSSSSVGKIFETGEFNGFEYTILRWKGSDFWEHVKMGYLPGVPTQRAIDLKPAAMELQKGNATAIMSVTRAVS